MKKLILSTLLLLGFGSHAFGTSIAPAPNLGLTEGSLYAPIVDVIQESEDSEKVWKRVEINEEEKFIKLKTYFRGCTGTNCGMEDISHLRPYIINLVLQDVKKDACGVMTYTADSGGRLLSGRQEVEVKDYSHSVCEVLYAHMTEIRYVETRFFTHEDVRVPMGLKKNYYILGAAKLKRNDSQQFVLPKTSSISDFNLHGHEVHPSKRLNGFVKINPSKNTISLTVSERMACEIPNMACSMVFSTLLEEELEIISTYKAGCGQTIYVAQEDQLPVDGVRKTIQVTNHTGRVCRYRPQNEVETTYTVEFFDRMNGGLEMQKSYFGGGRFYEFMHSRGAAE